MFYLYALPGGDLGRQIDSFRKLSLTQFGPNLALQYPAHVTLTRHFDLTKEKIAHYCSAMSEHFSMTEGFSLHNIRFIAKKQLVLIDLSGTQVAHSTLAWQAENAERLFSLAKEKIDLSAEVSWEVQLLERKEQNLSTPEWQAHGGVVLL